MKKKLYLGHSLGESSILTYYVKAAFNVYKAHKEVKETSLSKKNSNQSESFSYFFFHYD